MSSLHPIAVSSLSDEAFSKIVQAITAGEIAPGERISEAKLARQLGISRGPLREALGRLEGRLVERKPRIGVRVIDLTLEDLKHLMSVREALEGMATRLAAQHMTDRELKSLRDLLSRHGRDPSVLSPHGYFQKTADDDFHLRVVRGARNPRLEQLLMQELYYQLRMYRFKSSGQPGRAQAAYSEHVAIAEALAARDSDRAEMEMRRHVRNSYSSLASSFAGGRTDGRGDGPIAQASAAEPKRVGREGSSAEGRPQRRLAGQSTR